MSGKIIAPKNTTAKIYTITGFLLILSIGLLFINGIVHDRMKFRDEAVHNVEKTWGKAQTIGVGRLEYVDGKDEKTPVTISYDSVVTTTNAEAKVEMKRKGIYKVPVYTVKIKQTGEFDTSGTNAKKALFKVKVSDKRGFVSKPVLKYMGKTIDCSKAGCTVDINPGKIPYEIEYTIRGTKTLSFDASGTNETCLNTNWTSVPEYNGDFSPVEHGPKNGGYHTCWSVPEAASSIDERYKNLDYSITFLNTVDVYRMTERCVKYGFLFIALTFLAFFVYEIINKEKRHIHPFQYSLVGVSMLIFYLLLLSMSEFIGFSGAYFIAALMTILLIGFYAYFVLTNGEDKKFPLSIGGILSAVYLYLYITVNLEEFSLLVGSFGLFFTIIAVMYATRNVEWYKENS